MKKQAFKILAASAITLLTLMPHHVMSQSTINVKRYPKEMQNAYQLFIIKCSTCHGLESTIVGPEVTPSYFKSMVKRMEELPGSNMTPSDTDVITEFLIYDAYVRRNRDLRSQLKALPLDLRKEEVEALKKVRDKFQEKDTPSEDIES